MNKDDGLFHDQRKPRKRDLIWDKVVSVWFRSGVATSERSRVNRIVRDLKDMQATPEDIDAVVAMHRKVWPKIEVITPESVKKHWSSLLGRHCLEKQRLVNRLRHEYLEARSSGLEASAASALARLRQLSPKTAEAIERGK